MRIARNLVAAAWGLLLAGTATAAPQALVVSSLPLPGPAPVAPVAATLALLEAPGGLPLPDADPISDFAPPPARDLRPIAGAVPRIRFVGDAGALLPLAVGGLGLAIGGRRPRPARGGHAASA